MKFFKLIPLIVIGLIINSCIIRSINPWYNDDNVTFNSTLLGEWVNTDNEITIIFQKDKENAYFVQYIEEGDTTFFKAHLTNINDDYYLDYLPVINIDSGLAEEFILKLHSLMKMDMSKEQLLLYPLNYDWLKTKARAGELGELRYQWIDNDLILTSSTPVLRTFVTNNSHKKIFFGDPLVLGR